MMHLRLRAAIAAAAAVPFTALVPAIARGQAGPTLPPSGGGAGAATAPAPTAPAPQPMLTPYAPPAPPAGTAGPSGPVGGGNATESSARSRTGDEEDSFDLGRGTGGGGAAHGDDTGPIFVGGPKYGGGEAPSSHLVRHGDTLWGLCDYYLKNPYEWPRVWSYNPQIKNPNWIYPGDEVHLKSGPPEVGTAGGASSLSGLPYSKGGMSLIDRRRQVPNDTVFLRDQGWIRDDADVVWGEVSGSSEDKMFLTDFDEIYLHVDPGHDVHLGEELTIFRPLKSSAAGTIVQIEGTARIDQWNGRDRVARAQVVEALNVIERGSKVGPLARKFDVVPPRRNETEVQAHVLASVHPNVFFGQDQVIFIDQGEASGLKLGNRLFVVRRGDAWRRSLVTPGAGYRVSPDDESRAPAMEKTPGLRRGDEVFPDEIVGELRVVALKKDTATCIVTQSKLEIERTDLAVARKGY